MKHIEEELKIVILISMFIVAMLFIYITTNNDENYMLIDNPYIGTDEINLSQFSIEFDYQGNLDQLIFDYDQIIEVRLYDNGFIRIYLDQSTANDIWIKNYYGFAWIYNPLEDDSNV